MLSEEKSGLLALQKVPDDMLAQEQARWLWTYRCRVQNRGYVLNRLHSHLCWLRANRPAQASTRNSPETNVPAVRSPSSFGGGIGSSWTAAAV